MQSGAIADVMPMRETRSSQRDSLLPFELPVHVVVIPLADHCDVDGFVVEAIDHAVFTRRDPAVRRAVERLRVMRGWDRPAGRRMALTTWRYCLAGNSGRSLRTAFCTTSFLIRPASDDP